MEIGLAEASDKKLILLLEDEILIGMVLADLVESRGYAVAGPVLTCAAAIELVESLPIDAAILDVMVGDEHCGVVIDQLKARGIPWALSTAVDDDLLPLHYRSKWVLPKPTVPTDVISVLAEMTLSRSAS
ncbi:MAG: response regulator [Pseudomonadota bacterium]